MYICPKCKSNDVRTERRLNGDSRCKTCGFIDQTANFIFERKEEVKVKSGLNDNPIMKFFKFDHLPDQLKNVSRPFAELAYKMADILPSNAESVTALRKLLEAKECYYCGADLSNHTGSGIDRVDNSKGYIAGNCLPCCTSCNLGRGYQFTVEEWKVMATALVNWRKKKVNQ